MIFSQHEQLRSFDNCFHGVKGKSKLDKILIYDQSSFSLSTKRILKNVSSYLWDRKDLHNTNHCSHIEKLSKDATLRCTRPCITKEKQTEKQSKNMNFTKEMSWFKLVRYRQIRMEGSAKDLFPPSRNLIIQQH